MDKQKSKTSGYRLGSSLDIQFINDKILRINSICIFADARDDVGGQVPTGAVKIYYNHPETGHEYFIAGYPVQSFYVSQNQHKEFPRDLDIDVIIPTTKEEIIIYVVWYSGSKTLTVTTCYCNIE